MKSRISGLLVVALLVCVGAADAGIVAFDFTQAANQGWPGRLGNYFDVTGSPIIVTSLGVFDTLPDGLTGPIEVGIFDVAADSGNGLLLTSTTIGLDTPATLFHRTRFVPITSLVLSAGSYAVVAVGFDSTDGNFNTNLSTGTSVVTNTGGGLISIPGTSGFYDMRTTLGTNVGVVANGEWTFGGGSFQYEAVPDPVSTLLLLGMSLAGVAALKRFRA